MFGLAWRGALRGTLGADVPIVASRNSIVPSFVLVPFVELHNDRGSDSPLPNQSWRGRLALEAWWSGRSAGFGVGVEHESDHATSHAGAVRDFLELNDVALRALWTMPIGHAALTLGADARVYVFSCSRLGSGCEDFAGSMSFGATTSAVLDFGGARAAAGWHPFASVDASGITGAAQLVRERRIVAHVGAWSSTARAGTWALFVIGFAGNDVGIGRADSVAQIGVGASWTPRPP